MAAYLPTLLVSRCPRAAAFEITVVKVGPVSGPTGKPRLPTWTSWPPPCQLILSGALTVVTKMLKIRFRSWTRSPPWFPSALSGGNLVLKHLNKGSCKMWPPCSKTFGDFQSSRQWWQSSFHHRWPRLTSHDLELFPSGGYPTATPFFATFVDKTRLNNSFPLIKDYCCRDSFDVWS